MKILKLLGAIVVGVVIGTALVTFYVLLYPHTGY